MHDINSSIFHSKTKLLPIVYTQSRWPSNWTSIISRLIINYQNKSLSWAPLIQVVITDKKIEDKNRKFPQMHPIRDRVSFFKSLLSVFKLKQESLGEHYLTLLFDLVQMWSRARQDHFLRMSGRAHVWSNRCVYIVLPPSISHSVSSTVPLCPPTHTLLSASERGTVSPLLHGLSLTCFSFSFYYSIHCHFVAPPSNSPKKSNMTNICVPLSV